jgi:hypothetical protein
MSQTRPSDGAAGAAGGPEDDDAPAANKIDVTKLSLADLLDDEDEEIKALKKERSGNASQAYNTFLKGEQKYGKGFSLTAFLGDKLAAAERWLRIKTGMYAMNEYNPDKDNPLAGQVLLNMCKDPRVKPHQVLHCTVGPTAQLSSLHLPAHECVDERLINCMFFIYTRDRVHLRLFIDRPFVRDGRQPEF